MKKTLTQIDRLQTEINAFRPLSKEILSQLKEYYRIGLTYSSNALEGNSLTESETKVVLEDGLTIGGKPLRDHYEALGHSDAYDEMHRLVKGAVPTEEDIKKLHQLFYHRIDIDNAGKYRNVKVFVTGSHHTFPSPEKVSQLMKQFVERLESLRKRYHPVDYAALVHKDFVFIHPFVDGNGRIARLFMNLALLQGGYVIAIIPPILRAEYIRTLEKAHSDDKPFRQFIAERVLETQKEYLRLLKG